MVTAENKQVHEKPKMERLQSSDKMIISSTSSRVIDPPSRDNYHVGGVEDGAHLRGVTRYEPSGRDYANSPTRKVGASYEKGLAT